MAISGGKDAGKVFSFRCADCDELHVGSPSFDFDRPFHVYDVPEAERGERGVLNDDTCVIDSSVFFIRTLLEIPIHGVAEPFLWGVWVSQSADSFSRYLETFGTDQSGNSSFGWLTVTMPGYKRTRTGENYESLACDVLWQADGQRPMLRPHECDHPLYTDCVNGISWDRAVELAVLNMHP